MAYSENFGIFLEFLYQKYKELEKKLVDRQHLNWIGDETSIFINDTDVFDINYQLIIVLYCLENKFFYS